MVQKLKIESHIEINLTCLTLEVSRSGYYSWIERPESERTIKNAAILSRHRCSGFFHSQTNSSNNLVNVVFRFS